MRYRPFGRSGVAVSALSLALDDTPMRHEARIRLIYAALESGVNTFDIQTPDPSVADAVGEALQAVERSLVIVGLRVGWSLDLRGGRVRDLSPAGVTGAIESALASTGLGYLDLAVLDALESERLPTHVIPALESARRAGRVRKLGIAGADAADSHLGTGEFDVLTTPFNLQSGWLERNRLKRAGQADMAIIGCDFYPPGLGGGAAQERPAGPLGLGRFMGGRKESEPGPYDFLELTPGWSAEQICLGFALTEPALATVQTRVREPEAIEALASIVDRDLPTGLAAQIEMARFSGDQEAAALAKRRAGA